MERQNVCGEVDREFPITVEASGMAWLARPGLLGVVAVLALMGSTSCARDFELPGPSGETVGRLSGRVTREAAAGRAPLPLAGAELWVLGSSLAATTGPSGRFELGPMVRADGQLLVRYRASAGSPFELTRLFDLRELGVSSHQAIYAGDLVLSSNASVTGTARLRDHVGDGSGHAGTLVFTAGAPYATQTRDDGSFELGGLPAGALSLSFYREGYQPLTRGPLLLQSGERLLMEPLYLDPQTQAVTPVTVFGQLQLQPAGDVSAALASFAPLAGGVPLKASPSADGHFELPLDPGVYQLEATHPPTSTRALVPNLMVVPGGDGEGRQDLGTLLLAADQASVSEADPDPVAPVARIVSPTRGIAGGLFRLDASASSAPDGHPLHYRWSQTQGEQVTLDTSSGLAAVTPSFIAPLTPQVLGFELTVTDTISGKLASDRVLVTFAVPPTILLTAAAVTGPGQEVVLDATGTLGTQGASLIYHWRQSAGEQVSLSVLEGPDATVTRFVAPARPQVLSFGLVVEDSSTGLSAAKSVEVEVVAPPVACFVAPGAAATGSQLALDASCSKVPGGVGRYHWELLGLSPQPLFTPNDQAAAPGSSLDLSAGSGAAITGVFSLRLTVTDLATGLEGQIESTLLVDQPPVASIVPASFAAPPGSALRLDGSGSYGLPGRALSYQWTVTVGGVDVTPAGVSGPAASGLDLDLGAEDASVQLVVNDGVLNSSPVSALISSAPGAPAQPPSLQGLGTLELPLGSPVQVTPVLSSVYRGIPWSYQWTQTFGTPVSFDPSALSLSFASPAREAQLRFELQVSDPTGAGGSGTGLLELQILDQTPPSIVSWDPPLAGGLASTLQVSARFDEALDAGSVSATTVGVEDDLQQAVPGTATYDPFNNKVSFVPDQPFDEARSYTFKVGAVRDAAARRNVHLDERHAFQPSYAFRWSRWSGPPLCVTPLRPGTNKWIPYSGVTSLPSGEALVVSTGNQDLSACGGQTFQAQLLKPDRSGGSLLLSDPPGVFSEGTSIGFPSGDVPLLKVGSSLIYSWGVVTNGQAQVTTLSAAGAGAPFSVGGFVFSVGGSTVGSLRAWSTFTDGRVLYGGAVGWNLLSRAASGTVSADNPGTILSPSNPVGAWGAASLGGRVVLALEGQDPAVPGYSAELRERDPGGSWGRLVLPGSATGLLRLAAPSRIRLEYVGEDLVAVWVNPTLSQLTGAVLNRATGSWMSLGVLGASVEFAMLARGRTLYLARAQGGLVDLVLVDLDTAAQRSVPGPGTGGSLNVDPLVPAQGLDMAQSTDAIFISWQEVQVPLSASVPVFSTQLAELR